MLDIFEQMLPKTVFYRLDTTKKAKNSLNIMSIVSYSIYKPSKFRNFGGFLLFLLLKNNYEEKTNERD